MALRTPEEIKELLDRLRHELPYLGRGEIPPGVDLDASPLLDHWACSIDPPHRPVGFVRGHPRLEDGWITSSPLLWIDETRGAARTVSRYYRLGRRLGEQTKQ